MPILRSADAPRFTLEGTLVTGLAAPSRGSTEICAWRLRLEPGTAVPAHTVSKEEVFVALAGTATVTLDGEQSAITAGDALMVPAGTPFSLAVPDGAPFEAICAMTRGGLGQFVEGDGAAFPPPWSL